jgi:hypothetical protein
MATWDSGDPIGFRDDAEEQALWRQYRTLKLQRERRGRHRRIDYYAAPAADAVIAGLRNAKRGSGDASSVINRIILEWADIRRGN